MVSRNIEPELRGQHREGLADLLGLATDSNGDWFYFAGIWRPGA
jgi:hypothetical protein